MPAVFQQIECALRRISPRNHRAGSDTTAMAVTRLAAPAPAAAPHCEVSDPSTNEPPLSPDRRVRSGIPFVALIDSSPVRRVQRRTERVRVSVGRDVRRTGEVRGRFRSARFPSQKHSLPLR
jgi:hypothetical protein